VQVDAVTKTVDKRLATTWTVAKVVKKRKADKIHQLVLSRNPECKAEDKEYLALYAKCWSEITKALSDGKREKYQRLADQWNSEGVDAETQAQ
jgi:uncharacterized protein YqfA (UPF0365 family)